MQHLGLKPKQNQSGIPLQASLSQSSMRRFIFPAAAASRSLVARLPLAEACDRLYALG